MWTKEFRVLPWTSLFLIAFLIGCGSSSPPPQKLADEEITRKLVGKWREQAAGGIVKNEFTADGKYISEGVQLRPEGEMKFTITATWKVAGGVLIYTIETSKPAIFQEGEQLAEKVLAVNEQEFKYLDVDNKLQTMTRLP